MSGVLTLISFTPLEKSSAKVTQRSRRADQSSMVALGSGTVAVIAIFARLQARRKIEPT